MKKIRLFSFVLFMTFLLSLTLSAVDAAVPSAVTGLKATSASLNSIKLTWTALSGATKYRIYRSSSSGGTYAKIGETTSAAYTNLSLSSNTLYYYKVSAVNSSGEGAKSAAVYARTRTAAPSGVKATSVSSSSIKVTWTGVTGASKYGIYRSTSSAGTYTKVAEATTGTYTNTGLSSNKLYYYKIYAFNSGGWSAPSSAVYARTRTNAPTGVKATSVSSSSIKLTWTAVAGATKYGIYRSTSSGGTYSKAAEATTASYTNTGLSANKLYYYKVYAFNSGGWSASSSTVYARTRTLAPTGLKAVALNIGTIKLTWTVVNGASKYYIYRSTSSSGTYSKVGEALSSAYTDTGLSADELYYYKVYAFNSGGTSAPSSVVSVTTPASNLSAPTGFNAKTYNYQSVQLYYDGVQNAATYRIYYSTVASSDISAYSYFDFAGVDCRVIGLNASTTYYFRVAAVDGSGKAGIPTGYLAAKTSVSPGNPPQPNFYLYSIEDIGSYRLNFYRRTSPIYPSIYEPTFECYFSNTEAGLASDTPDICDLSQYFYEDVPYGQSRWFGFRACYGPYKSTMQKLHFAALGKPVNVKTTPISSTVTLSWNSVYAASKYKLYVCVAPPDPTVPWQQFRDSALASGNLVYKGTTTGTSYTFTGMPNYSSRYYIVVPTDSSGVEGWFCGYAIGSVFY